MVDVDVVHRRDRDIGGHCYFNARYRRAHQLDVASGHLRLPRRPNRRSPFALARLLRGITGHRVSAIGTTIRSYREESRFGRVPAHPVSGRRGPDVLDRFYPGGDYRS